MQPLQPLSVADVGLAARDVLGIPSVDEYDLEAALVQNFEDWNPVDSRGLHSDCAHAAVLEPVRQPVQIARESAEIAHRFGILFRSYRCYVHRSANVDFRCAWVGGRNVPEMSRSMLKLAQRRSPNNILRSHRILLKNRLARMLCLQLYEC